MKKNLLMAFSINVLSLAALSGIAFISTSSDRSPNAIHADVVKTVWNHYEKVEPTDSYRGIREYWLNCDNYSHQFEAPDLSTATIRDMGAPTQQFINSLDEGDDRLFAPLSFFNFLLQSSDYGQYYGVYCYTDIGEYVNFCIPSLYNSVPVGRIVSLNPAYGKSGQIRDIDFSNNLFEIGSSNDGYHGLSNFSGLISITLPDSIIHIGKRAFSNCTALESITLKESNNPLDLPANTGSIEEYAFSECSSLKEIELPISIQSIGDFCFNNCTSLPIINIPNSVTNIGTNAFIGCSSLSSATLSNNLVLIPDGLFNRCSLLQTVNIQSNITSLGGSSFFNCTSLVSISLPNSVETIGDSAFAGCSSLKNINTPTSLTSIGRYCFSGCTSLSSFDLPTSLLALQEGTFCDCSSLNEIELPSSIQSIGNQCFSGCSLLASIYIPDSVTTINQSAFKDCSILVIYCKASSKPEGWSDAWLNYQPIPVIYGVNNYNPIIINDIHYQISDANNVDIIGSNSVASSITIPSSVRIGENDYSVSNIKDNSFSYSPAITININGGTRIGVYAFFESSAKNININSNVTYLASYAFYRCLSLESINLPNTVTSVNSMTFGECTSLHSIRLPNSIVELSLRAFYGCTSLEDIYFDGTTTQWETIKKTSSVDPNVPADVIHCSDGDVAIQ